MLHQKIRIPKYTENINPNKNKPRPNMDAIIKEQRAEELQKKLLAEQCEHNLDDIPADILLESYMLSQIEEQKDNNNNNNNTGDNNNNNKNNNDQAQEEHDRLLAMQLEFALEEESTLANIDNFNHNTATASATTPTDSSSNKKTLKGNSNRYKNETKIRIQPNYYFDDKDKNNGERDNAEREEYGHEEEAAGEIYDTPKNNNNNNNSKVRHEGYGNKTALSGTANRHRFEEWSEKHVNRLHEYNVNLGGESEFKNVRLGNKAYNSFRRDLEKKGFKKFDQPTPAEKK